MNPATALRHRLIASLNPEFAGDTPPIVFGSDKLNDSLGTAGPIGAVYPATDAERVQNVSVVEVTVYIQLFNQWTAVVDPKQVYDPDIVEAQAERIRRVAQAETIEGPNDAHLWFYRVTRIDYPPDPTGNISRLLATVVGTAQNPATVATSG